MFDFCWHLIWENISDLVNLPKNCCFESPSWRDFSNLRIPTESAGFAIQIVVHGDSFANKRYTLVYIYHHRITGANWIPTRFWVSLGIAPTKHDHIYIYIYIYVSYIHIIYICSIRATPKAFFFSIGAMTDMAYFPSRPSIFGINWSHHFAPF